MAGSARRRAMRSVALPYSSGEPAPKLDGSGSQDGESALLCRVAELEAEVARLRQELEDSQALLAETERLADEDTLAPVANRRAFARELRRLVSFAARYGTASSILYIDVNDMKLINDQLGHAAGDAALMHIARMLLANVRNSDVVGRLGGDEFGILLTQADAEAAAEKAQILTDLAASTPFAWKSASRLVRISCGAHTLQPGETADAALAAADAAMYERKKAAKVGR